MVRLVSVLARPFGRALRRSLRLPGGSHHVSILARPFGRALRSAWTPCSWPGGCFNPRPPFRTGATCNVATVKLTHHVSILARPFGRALHVPEVESTWQKVFQSSPALSDGRYLQGDRGQKSITGFNPRPPFRTGATGSLLSWCFDSTVSILARPFGRALPTAPVPAICAL